MRFGATHAYGSIEEATEAVRDMTEGVMCERVVLSPGVVEGTMVAAGHGPHQQGRHPGRHRPGSGHGERRAR